MSTPKNELTPDEIDTIKRFVLLISDAGIHAHLVLLMVRNYGNGEAHITALDDAIEDILDTCEYSEGGDAITTPEDVTLAAPSLALVVQQARHAYDVWPVLQTLQDVIPTDETVRKCLRHYYEFLQERAARTSGSR